MGPVPSVDEWAGGSEAFERLVDSTGREELMKYTELGGRMPERGEDVDRREP